MRKKHRKSSKLILVALVMVIGLVSGLTPRLTAGPMAQPRT